MTKPARGTIGDRYGAFMAALAATACAACVDELPAPPLPPGVTAPTLTNQPQLTLRGTKQASTAIVLSTGETLVALDEATSWSALVELRAGTNAFSLAARDALDQQSASVSASVVLDDDPPDAPELDPVAPTTLQDVVTLTGTKSAGDRVEVNGGVRPTGSSDNTAFSIDVALADGDNVVRVATLDQAGNESDVVELVIERAGQVPFTVAVPASTVGAAALTVGGTRAAGVEVLLDDAVVVPASATGGSWAHDVTLTPGANDLGFAGRIELEPDSRSDVSVDVFYDDAAPALTIDAPVAATFIDDDALPVSGTVSDASSVTVDVCVGSCAVDGDFLPAIITGGSWAGSLDLSGRGDLPDGAFANVVVRATDLVQRRTTVSAPVLVGRAPVVMPGAAELDLASGPLYLEARAFLDAAGAAWVQLDLDGPPWAPASARISDPSATSAAAPQVVLVPGGAAAVVLEDSPAASATTGERGLVYAEVTPAGATRSVVAQGDLGAAVTSADLALGASGTLVAWSQGDQVLFAAEGAGGLTFGTPIQISDGTTLAPAHVRLARLSATRSVVVWAEVSDRDGTLDDTDVVARVIDDAGAALGPVVLISAGAGDSVAPEVTALDGDTVVIGYLDGGAALIGGADVAALVAGTAPAVLDAAAVTGGGTVSALSLAGGGGRLAVCWLDDGPGLVGAAGPGLVVRDSATGPAGLGAPSVPASPVSAASCALDDDVLHLSWIASGTLSLQPRVLP